MSEIYLWELFHRENVMKWSCVCKVAWPTGIQCLIEIKFLYKSQFSFQMQSRNFFGSFIFQWLVTTLVRLSVGASIHCTRSQMLLLMLSSEKNCRKFLGTTITKKWYPVTRLTLYQLLKILLPWPWEKYKCLRKLMLRYFLHSCFKIQARKEKDHTSEMRLNSAKNVRLKKAKWIKETF